MIGDSLVFDRGEIMLKAKNTWLDTCHSTNRQLIEFEIFNDTKQALLFNGELNCWDDSGLQSGYYLSQNHLIIKPGESGKVKILVNNSKRHVFNTRSMFAIFSGKSKLYVPISLLLRYTSEKCGK
jgi:hypothetical protein